MTLFDGAVSAEFASYRTDNTPTPLLASRRYQLVKSDGAQKDKAGEEAVETVPTRAHVVHRAPTRVAHAALRCVAHAALRCVI